MHDSRSSSQFMKKGYKSIGESIWYRISDESYDPHFDSRSMIYAILELVLSRNSKLFLPHCFCKARKHNFFTTKKTNTYAYFLDDLAIRYLILPLSQYTCSFSLF